MQQEEKRIKLSGEEMGPEEKGGRRNLGERNVSLQWRERKTRGVERIRRGLHLEARGQESINKCVEIQREF